MKIPSRGPHPSARRSLSARPHLGLGEGCQIDHFLIDSDRAIGAQALFEQTQNEQTQKKKSPVAGLFFSSSGFEVERSAIGSRLRARTIVLRYTVRVVPLCKR